MRETKQKKMDKKKIKSEFNEFVDNASEETLRDFVRYMKARKKKKEDIDAKIREVLNDDYDGDDLTSETEK